ncbi:MAG: DUF454 domain-containing protein [Candidatus Moranbacteria bacterium]|nr:DUF454 domain-containing protein [Candidatus Moranbacteria bacterium]
MKALYIFLGHLFLFLGLLGVLLPILPTTPFLLLTAYFFAKGSQRFKLWFESTRIYQRHLEPFIRNRAMTKKQKWTLMLFVDTLLILSFILISSVILKSLIVVMVLFKHYYFHFHIKTIN